MAKLKTCTQLITELSKKIDEFKSKQNHQDPLEGHPDMRFSAIRVKDEACDEQPLEMERRPIKKEPRNVQPLEMEHRTIKEEPRDEQPPEEETLPKKRRVVIKDEPM